jgi:hypothetical protein
MKRLLTILLFILASPLYAATWYATSSSVNINATSLWVPTQGASCAGSGTALVWGAQANGDTFNANGCTALAVNVDPGSGTWTGTSAGNCGTGGGTTTLTTDATNGGAFTYATANSLVMHMNVTATKTTALTISGTTANGGTICGNLIGGSTSSQFAINDTHSSGTVYYVGNTTGGSASASGLDINGAGTFNIVGNASAGSVGSGFSTATGSATINMTGNCIGSNSSGQAFGCVNTNAATFTLTGNLISGLKGGAYYGAIIYTPAASNYTLYAKDSSYTLNTINTHSTLMPTDPGVSNVKSGVVYGAGTGTYGGGAGLCDTGGW